MKTKCIKYNDCRKPVQTCSIEARAVRRLIKKYLKDGE